MRSESEFTKNQFKELDKIIDKYKDKPGALISVLHQAQEVFGYLPLEIQERIAKGLNTTITEVYGIVTFYTFFTMVPRGKHTIRVCMGTSCYVRGGRKVLEAIQKRLGIKVGETTEDRNFSLEIVRCVGACALSPAVLIDNDIYKRARDSKIPEILAKY